MQGVELQCRGLNHSAGSMHHQGACIIREHASSGSMDHNASGLGHNARALHHREGTCIIVREIVSYCRGLQA